MTADEQVRAIKANDEQALKRLYVGNFDRVKQFVMVHNGTADDAKDIYHEAYLAVWRNIQMDKFVPRHEGALEAYLVQIARNKWLDHVRTSRYRLTDPLTSDSEVPMTFEAIDDITERRLKLIKMHFRKLGERCRKLLARFYYRNESMKKIAADMGWTEASAKNNKYRCMEKLLNMVK